MQDVVDIRNLSLVYTLAGGRSSSFQDMDVCTISPPFFYSARNSP